MVNGQLAAVSPNGFVQAGAGNNILIYSEGVLVSRTTSDDIGKFSVSNLSPGVHGIVVVGPAGYAAFAFEADDYAAVTKTRSNTNGQTFVTTSAADQKLVCAVQDTLPPVIPTIPSDMVPPFTVVEEDEDQAGFVPPGQSPPGFVGPGGGGFGGGAGGMGGGLGGGLGGIAGGGGGLVGLAAIGGVAAAAIGASNNDDNVTPPVNTNGQP